MANKEYKCAMCGTWHTDIVSRAKCEIACTEKKVEEERKAAEAKKEAEYSTRKEEVDAAYEKYIELRNKFAKDYGSYEYRTVRSSTRYLPFSWMV